MTGPLANPRWEAYCRARVAGKSQRQAMLEAYPSRVKWSDNALDSEASRLEADPKVSTRLAALKEEAAAACRITRTEVLDGMADTYRRSVEANGRGLSQVAVQAVSSIGRTLLEELPRDRAGDADPGRSWDFGLMVAPPHLAPHRAVASGAEHDLWLYGGRASAKSSYVSLEIAAGMMSHPDRSALVCMKVGQYMRESVFEQVLWALRELGCEDEWQPTAKPLRITRPATGQAFVFRGCDRGEKSKAIRAPGGTYFCYQWFEEADQFDGMREVRTVQQSATRGAAEDAEFFRFYTFNPPRSRGAWPNLLMARREADGLPVHRSSYLDVPREWLPAQTVADAEALRDADPESYRHEWLGEAVGFGSNVFQRVEVREVTDDERRALGERLYGVDWGFSQDPWVFVEVAYDRRTRTLYVLGEMSGLGLTNAETAEMVRGRLASATYEAGYSPTGDPWADAAHTVDPAGDGACVMCDGAEPKSVEDYRQAGIRADAPPKHGAFSVRSGVRWLQQRAAIVVDPRCRVSAAEFAGYEYEVTRDGEVTGRLPDRDNHAIDAVRYACSTLIADRSCV